jgi:hypothetical protein
MEKVPTKASFELSAITSALLARGWSVLSYNQFRRSEPRATTDRPTRTIRCTITNQRNETITGDGFTKFDAARAAHENAGLGMFERPGRSHDRASTGRHH